MNANIKTIRVPSVVHKPRILDAFCGAGGCAVGYARAGFEVVGVDIAPQPNYPFPFVQGDAMTWLELFAKDEHAAGAFDAIHASPPCQHYANVTRWRGSPDDHPDLLGPTRELLRAIGLPYVIENVRTRALRPCVVLCGSMFDLPVRRHRGFETSWGMSPMVAPCRHRSSDLAFEHKYERAYADAMGCEWMSAREARQAIPPAYTEHIGSFLMTEIRARQETAA